jgi:hypothetical protein
MILSYLIVHERFDHFTPYGSLAPWLPSRGTIPTFRYCFSRSKTYLNQCAFGRLHCSR